MFACVLVEFEVLFNKVEKETNMPCLFTVVILVFVYCCDSCLCVLL